MPRCEYCNRDKDKTKLCQLSPNPHSKNAEWQFPKDICADCRRYLRGVFRLSPVSKEQYRKANNL